MIQVRKGKLVLHSINCDQAWFWWLSAFKVDFILTIIVHCLHLLYTSMSYVYHSFTQFLIS